MRRGARGTREPETAQAPGPPTVAESGDDPVHVRFAGRAGGVGDPRAGAFGGVEDVGLEPGVPALQDGLGQPLVRAVGVVPERDEEPLYSQSGLPAESVGELDTALVALAAEHLGADTARRHREQLGPDVDDPGQKALLALQTRLPARHPVERLAGQPA